MTVKEFAEWLLKNFHGYEEIVDMEESANYPDGSIQQLNIQDLFVMATEEA